MLCLSGFELYSRRVPWFRPEFCNGATNLCLTSTYFQYNAMGSPVSVVEAEIVMQNIEEQALATFTQTGPLWLRYVDDSFTTVRKDRIDDFHEHLNRQNADIQFTKEIKENGKIPFLDLLGHLWQQQTKNNYLQKTDTYRPITRPVFVQPELSQGYYYPDFDEMSVTTLRLTWQPTRQDWLS